MCESKKAYVITQGDYSDYGIVAVFSTRELADAYCSRMNATRKHELAEVEEWLLDPLDSETIRDGKYLRVLMDRDGNTSKVTEETFPFPDPITHVHFRNITLEGEGLPNRAHPKATIAVSGWFRDKKHCVKVANEKRSQLLALPKCEKQWGNHVWLAQLKDKMDAH